MDALPFVVIVFLSGPEAPARADMARRVKAEITAVCSAAPLNVKSNDVTMCLLVLGDLSEITKALDLACASDTRYLVVRAAAPFEASGLSAAGQFLQSQTRTSLR